VETKSLPGSSRSGGLLLAAFRAGQTEEINWTEVTVGDLVITVAADAMKATLNGRSGVRLPVSYADTVTICRELGCVAPTQAMCDAMFAQARSQLALVALVRTAADSTKLATVDFSLRFDDGVHKQLAAIVPPAPGLVFGAWKLWILHPRIAEKGAVNYGFWDKTRKPPRPVQTVGGQHDANHSDYSQVLQPVKRMARDARTGAEVDLLEYIEKHDRVPARYLDVYDTAKPSSGGTIRDLPGEPTPVNLLDTLTYAGIDVVPHDGWETRGRKGFAPIGILVHHTAVASRRDAPTLDPCINGRKDAKNPQNDLPGPLSHILLSRSGKAHVIAANVANHAGKGAQEVLDLIRRDEPVTGNAIKNKYRDAVSGNDALYGIEVENAGTRGDPYPPEQILALAKICAALCHAHGWTANRVVHHRQWTARKYDMSYDGDVPGLVAQLMDSGGTIYGISSLPDEEVMYEPEENVIIDSEPPDTPARAEKMM
jgi:N-acetylmuramoyl-L-alanine amidase